MKAVGNGHSEVATILKRYKLRPIVEQNVERQKERRHFEEIMENEIFHELPSEYKHESMQYLGGKRKTKKSKKKSKKKVSRRKSKPRR